MLYSQASLRGYIVGKIGEKVKCANPTVLPKLKTIKLLRFHGVDKKTQNRVAVSILKVIECIHAEYPEIEVQNLGEQDFIITYEEQQSVGGVWHILKTSQVVLISFMGAGAANPAISYALSNAAPVVAMIWGVFVWKEFKDAPQGTHKLIAAMFALFIIGLISITLSN